MRRAPQVTLLMQTSKFCLPYLALISQALFKFSLLHESFPDSHFSLVNFSQIGSLRFWCKNCILRWTASCLFQPLPQTFVGTCRFRPTRPKLVTTSSGTISSSEDVVCCPWPDVQTLGCLQEQQIESSCLPSNVHGKSRQKKSFWPGSLVHSNFLPGL